jgi:predicted phage terminase large subunit-like protein|tara:strand:+ start:1632 stop:3185 length:1554 start_codon:yes stop_codon:yes gene_type:complete
MSEAELDFTEEEIQVMLDNLEEYTSDEMIEVDKLVSELDTRKKNKLAYDDLIEFCKRMMPEFLVGKHHRILADMLMAIEQGDKDRVCVNIPPRHGKSQLVSIFFPAWYLGRNPNKKVMMVSHTTDLAVDFGRKVRNLIGTDDYVSIFPTVALASDSKSAGRWNTSVGGEYYACGVGSALAGRGADLLLIDDPHSEQDVISGNFSVFEKAYEWYTFGARTRLMPGGRVAIIQTRWHMDDLTGRVVRDMGQNERADNFEVIEFPAILDLEDEETGEPIQKPLWPEFFDLEALLRTKASMPVFQWNAQYQQEPTAEEAAIVKREWWNKWIEESPPECEYIIMSLDSAAEKHNRADYTALTTWGVFYNEEASAYNIILLNSIKQRLEFPELKDLAMEEYEEWEPDAFIVEKKSSGVALYQEMRRMGLPVQEFTPHRGSGDKLARLNSVADIIASGLVWVPENRWAEEVIEEIAGFPFMSHDDLVDSTVMALMRFRQGGFIRLPTDEPEETRYFKQRRSGYY